MNDFASHLRYTVRSLLRAPVFTAATILTIALGTGVNTAVFSVVYSALLDPLPFREPQRLVHISETHPEFPSFQVAAPDYADWQTMAKSFGEKPPTRFRHSISGRC